MKIKEIKKLAKASYTNDMLDEKKVATIASLLSRKNLKMYIKTIKQIENQKNIIIALPNLNVYNKNEKIFENFFPNKRIEYQEDPSLLLGTRIQENDMIYDFSLKQRLNNEVAAVSQNYE